MLEISFILKSAHTFKSYVRLSWMEKKWLTGMFVHVPRAHIVIFDWSVLLFNEWIKRSETRLAPVWGGGAGASSRHSNSLLAVNAKGEEGGLDGW